MHVINFEFKAKTNQLKVLEEKLCRLNPEFKGEDHQTDTYFNVDEGRLKLREGNIENALIFYKRSNAAMAKKSDIILYKHAPDAALKNILIETLGIKVIVDKKRRIYFTDNVKFHFDEVKDLGTFIEVEAIDETGTVEIKTLKAQCDTYFDYFGLKNTDYVAESYSDLLIEKIMADKNR